MNSVNIPSCYRLDDCQFLSKYQDPIKAIEQTFSQYRWVVLKNRQLLPQRNLEPQLSGQLYCDLYKGPLDFDGTKSAAYALRGLGVIPTDETPYYPPFVFKLQNEKSGDLTAYIMNSELTNTPVTMKRNSFVLLDNGISIWGAYTGYYQGDEYILAPIQCEANKEFSDSLFTPTIEKYVHGSKTGRVWIAGVY